MRILYISHITNLSGGSLALLNLICEVSKDNEVFVLLPEKTGWLVEQLQKLNIPLYFYKYKLMWYSTSLKSFCRKSTLEDLWNYLFHRSSEEKYVLSLLVKLKPDIVHCNCGPLDISLNPCKKMHIPHVWHLREYQDLDFGCRMFYGKKHFISRLHTKGNYNIAITKGVFEHFHLRSCDRVIYDGPLDTSKLKNSVNKQNVVLFVGNFLRGKRVDLAISAFALFHKQFPQYKLLLVGDMLDTHYTQECKNLVEKNGLDQSVCFMGRRQDVYDLMSVSKMLIVPSNFEGFGFVTVEGMANNCLVIGRNTAGTKEQMDKGLKECGHEIAYRFNNLDELVNCMLRAAETDTSQLRTFAKNVVLTNYTKEIHARRVISFYKDILSDYNLKYARG